MTMSLGAIIGLAGGLACGRLVDTLLFKVKPTDPGIVLGPILLLVSTAVLGALHPAVRAVRIDPAATLRSE